MKLWVINVSEWDPTPKEWNTLTNLLDSQSRERINKFYHKADAKRALIGRLLPRVLLSSPPFNIPFHDIKFGATSANRPYLESPTLPSHHLPFDFNVSHDSDFVIMAWITGSDFTNNNNTLSLKKTNGDVPPSVPVTMRVGADVMKLKLPVSNEDCQTLVEEISMQFHPSEFPSVSLKTPSTNPPHSPTDQLLRFYKYWTFKESLTKSLGQGLGFEFNRLSLTFPNYPPNHPSSSLKSDELPLPTKESLQLPSKVEIDGKELENFRYSVALLEGWHLAVVCEGPFRAPIQQEDKDANKNNNHNDNNDDDYDRINGKSSTKTKQQWGDAKALAPGKVVRTVIKEEMEKDGKDWIKIWKMEEFLKRLVDESQLVGGSGIIDADEV